MQARTPIDATIAITYRCNSRCQMCNIWQIKNPAELPATALANLPSTLRYINLTGGETFLHSDLANAVRTVKTAAPRAQIIISSNGLATSLIIKKMRDIMKIDPTIGVRISIDGLGDLHDEIRGISGIYAAAMDTLEGLKDIGVKNLGLSFTIMDRNLYQLRKVYEHSRELGVELALQAVQNSDIYFQKADNRISEQESLTDELDFVIAEELLSWQPKRWARAFYDYGLSYFAATGKRLLPSGAGYDSFFIDPLGHVYPSNLISLEMGNIQETKFADIWYGEKGAAVRERIERDNITEAWIICTLRGEMRRHILHVLWWVFWRKVRVHLD